MKPALQKPPGYRDPAQPQPQQPPPQPKPAPSMRKPYVPPSFHPKRKRRLDFCSCRRCCCLLCVSLLLVLIMLAVASAVFYIWFDPKLPKFHLQSLKTPKFNVAVKPDGTFLDARTVARVEATNPNHKLRFEYGETELRASVGNDDDDGDDVELGSGHVPGFVQGNRNTTVLKFETEVRGAQIEDGIGRKLKVWHRTNELVVSVEVRTRFGIGVGKFRLGMVPVRVRCGGVSLKKLDAGATPQCTINILKWINLH